MPLHYLSHEKKNSFNTGDIIPIGCIEALPGDSFQHKVDALMRTQPLFAPLMHTVECKIHHWFVPLRLIWDDFEDFITGGRDGLDTTAAPVVDAGSSGFTAGGLADHLGLPTGTATANKSVSALPFRAYNLIYNEFYRDQDLQDPIDFSTASGEDTTTPVNLLKACWEKDYFTSARPTQQKGDEVNIPLSGNAPVVTGATSATGQPLSIQDGNGDQKSMNAGDALVYRSDSAGNTDYALEADLSDVSAVSINDLRLAVKLQVYKENMLRHGSRYVERLMSAFGVRPQDSRLQLPEYLGGGKQVVQFSEVLQTAEGTDPVGNMAGHGIAAMRSNRYRKYIPEYGFVMSFCVIRPKTAYQNGIHKMWLRQVKEDYFQPELQHIGMQAIQNQELYANSANPENTFGFQDRYDEYRFMFDQVSGELRDTLKYWHMGRIFESEPALNADFVRSEPTNRVFSSAADYDRDWET